MGTCCSRCSKNNDTSAVAGGATSDGFIAATSFSSTVTPVSFRPRDQLDILPPQSTHGMDPRNGVENLAFDGSDVASATRTADVSGIVHVLSSSSPVPGKLVSHGPKAHFHFPDWLASMTSPGSRCHPHGAPSANNNRRQLAGIAEQVNECGHAAGGGKCEACEKIAAFFTTQPARDFASQHSVGEADSCMQRQLMRDHVASSSLRQQPVSQLLAEGLGRRDGPVSDSTKQQEPLHQSSNYFNHNHHSFHGDDVYRIFVESSWQIKSSLISLFAANLSKNSAVGKKRKNEWIQLSGHSGTFAVAGPWSIWKRRDPREVNELRAYKLLMQSDQLRQFVPIFYREVEHQGEFFLELEDLLHHFHNPSIMDVKMGTRTFLESEVTNPVLRTDLFKKMVELDPNEPDDEERVHQAVTKLRYMRFREKESTSVTLGFRLDAIRTKHQKTCEQFYQRLKTAKTEAEVADIMHYFCAYNPAIMRQFSKRLKELRAVLEASNFFITHEFIGSSLLFLHDETLKANVWMIDFAKTVPHQELRLSHTAEWQLGNHEDGYLTGLNNLIRLLEGVADQYV